MMAQHSLRKKQQEEDEEDEDNFDVEAFKQFQK
jgi:hypothetical protein